MDLVGEVEEPRRRLVFWKRLLDHIEATYLAALRAVLLVIATIAIVAAVVMSGISLYRLSRSPTSVHEKTAIVAPAELLAAPPIGEQGDHTPSNSHAEERRGYSSFVQKYYQLFRTQFESFRHQEDKPLTQQQFDDNYVGTQQRLSGVSSGDTKFSTDIRDLNQLLEAMRGAAGLSRSQAALGAYKHSSKLRVCRSVEKTRSNVVSGWDRSSTTCSTWYIEPIGCAASRVVEVPYTTRECRMEYPKGVEAYSAIFRKYQDRFFQQLTEKRRMNAEEAATKRQEILDGNLRGKTGLVTALEIAGAFLFLMFMFLLIALERHQRKIALGAL